MSKPQMKSEIASGEFSLAYYWINFSATPDAASAMAEFGNVSKSSTGDNNYILWVDRRFDLMEVYRYIQEYGKP